MASFDEADPGAVPLSADDCLDAGRYWFDQSDLEAAEAWWRRGLELDPDNEALSSCLGWLEDCAALGFSDEAGDEDSARGRLGDSVGSSAEVRLAGDARVGLAQAEGSWIEEAESGPATSPHQRSRSTGPLPDLDLSPGWLMPSWLATQPRSDGAPLSTPREPRLPAVAGAEDSFLVAKLSVDREATDGDASEIGGHDIVASEPLHAQPLMGRLSGQGEGRAPDKTGSVAELAHESPSAEDPWSGFGAQGSESTEVAAEPALLSFDQGPADRAQARPGPIAVLEFSGWDQGPGRTATLTLLTPENNVDVLPGREPRPRLQVSRQDVVGRGIVGQTADLRRVDEAVVSAEVSQRQEPGSRELGSEAFPAPMAETTPPFLDILRGARDRFALHDFEGALELLQKVPEHSRVPSDGSALQAEVSSLLSEARGHLLKMYEARIGDLDVAPRVLLSREEIIWLNLNHRAGFILSQVDGTVTYEDLISLSGMSRLDTLRILMELKEGRVIGSVGRPP